MVSLLYSPFVILNYWYLRDWVWFSSCPPRNVFPETHEPLSEGVIVFVHMLRLENNVLKPV